MNKFQSFDDFVKVHGVLLAAAGIPQSLYKLLFQKLSSDTFDGGHYFQIEPIEDGRQRRLLFTSDSIAKHSNLFLVDHAWTFRLSDAYKQLCEVPGLAERMAALMCVDVDLDSAAEEAGEEDSSKLSAVEIVEREMCKVKEGRDDTRWLELEELDIDDHMLVSLDLPSKFPNLLALSLCGNNLRDVEVVSKEVTHLNNLKALWLNNNPFLEHSNSEAAIIQGCPSLEICNSKFTSNYGEWALGFCGGIYDKDNADSAHQREHPLESVTSLDLSNRFIRNLMNKAFNPEEITSLSYLNLRGNPLDQNSLNDLLQLLKGFSCLHSLEVDIPGPLGESAAEIVEALPNLSLLNGVNTSKIMEYGKSVVDSMLQPCLPEWTAGEPLTDRVINAMWLYLMTYRLADEEKIDETSVWYVMDELGSALRHSDKPNFRVSPFLYMPEGNLASAVRFSS
uniref:Tubulin--tyrosine ligase 12 n=1 Tax=Solanum tuberosum TaxID=4113 RepID=M1BN35_SOLTU